MRIKIKHQDILQFSLLVINMISSKVFIFITAIVLVSTGTLNQPSDEEIKTFIKDHAELLEQFHQEFKSLGVLDDKGIFNKTVILERIQLAEPFVKDKVKQCIDNIYSDKGEMYTVVLILNCTAVNIEMM
ncbi:hypothetical protein HHI36_021020 [Cryptolaemus montrouzieri]|uniref:Uncharacterized protein n=1 Tax=Cryptolaemus montrouzieri TaxID=559131 RepID=A0ABD2MWH1_9CUCU